MRIEITALAALGQACQSASVKTRLFSFISLRLLISLHVTSDSNILTDISNNLLMIDQAKEKAEE
ncbi:MAG: hypothetical protein IKG34_06630 [Solobacterium sp.]|nr:hypothetical protein [Solobacterium sp.]